MRTIIANDMTSYMVAVVVTIQRNRIKGNAVVYPDVVNCIAVWGTLTYLGAK